MKIPLCPQPSLGLIPDLDNVNENVKLINSQLNNANFDDRYYPKFNWFKPEILQADTILNIGCGQGKETFALMWVFNKTVEVIGVDKDEDTKRKNIFMAEMLANTIEEIQNFETRVIPYISKKYPLEYIEKVKIWHDNLPIEIKASKIPTFQKQDISKMKLQPPNHFSLIYSRYVLDKILLNEGEEGLVFALQNMVDVVQPITGRIVFVVPTKNKQIRYNFEEYIPKALILVKIERDEQQLGDLEWAESEPIGYIYAKQA